MTSRALFRRRAGRTVLLRQSHRGLGSSLGNETELVLTDSGVDRVGYQRHREEFSACCLVSSPVFLLPQFPFQKYRSVTGSACHLTTV
jgi:hypothetical protein